MAYDHLDSNQLRHEIWRPLPIKNLERRYSISSLGRVRREGAWLAVGNELMTGTLLNGYIRFAFARKVRAFGHNLVAKAFIPQLRPNDTEVNHKNGIRHDNRVSNLEWCSRSENALHKYRVLNCDASQGQRNPFAKLTDNDVHIIRQLLAKKIKGVEIANRFNVSTYCISNIKVGKTWTHLT